MHTQQQQLLDRVAELKFEVDTLKRSSEFRVGQLARRYGLLRVARLLSSARKGVLHVRATSRHNPDSKGSEVWVLGVRNNAGEPNLPWELFETDKHWRWQYDNNFPYGRCAVATHQAHLSVRVAGTPQLTLLAHPWSGIAEIELDGRSQTIDLYSPTARHVTVTPATTPMLDPRQAPREPGISPPSAATRTPYQEQFLERVRAEKPRVLAVTCPRWLGVTSSTRSLFDHVYHIPESREHDPSRLTPEQLRLDADVLVESGVEHLVFSGGDEFHYNVMRMVKDARPAVRCDLFLHSSYPQWWENYEWGMFKAWAQAARDNIVHCIASDKAGYDRFLRSQGLRGHVLLNRAPGTLLDAPDLPSRERRVGMWISGTTYRKNPHAALAALAMVPDVRLRGAGFDKRALEVAEFLRIPMDRVLSHQLPHDQLFAAIRETHLTLYVTFIECCPMLPLESLHQGVPCLVGPNSHLFEDDPYLFDRLVVRFPDRADVIADAIERAFAERHQIVHAYRDWYRAYEQRSRQSFERFLAL